MSIAALALSSLASLLPASPQDPARTPAAEAEAPRRRKAPEVELTFLANDGFLLRSGGMGVLIDGFVKEPYDVYEALPADVFRRMMAVEPPFDGTVVCLVSHRHPDHFQPRIAERYLKNNRKAGMFSSPQVIQELGKNAKDPEFLKGSVGAIPVEEGMSQAIVQRDMSVELFALRHGGGGNEDIQNYGHLITLGGLRILHLGDVDIDASIFAPYDFASREIDVALVPYWFLGSDEGRRIVLEEIRPAHVVACHIPPAEREAFAKRIEAEMPRIVVFREPMESRTYPGRRAKKNRRPGADARQESDG